MIDGAVTTNRKGAIAETAIAARAVRLGIEVYKPISEGGRFDFLFVWPDDRIERVQCKYAPLRNGAVIAGPTPPDALGKGCVYAPTRRSRSTRS